MILIFVTIHKKEDAVKIGKGLLQKKLIACYNLFPIESAYWWKGKIEENKEILMILKTKQVNFEQIETYIKEHSGYEV
ncbi:MAG TPA: divalent-cation tolerance protein CutA, partial [Candidatus Saccharimonadales bacterium]|nr:divalent-cation tolerance protein CutA [Candidatus Saccharimonadales bacterium]